MKKTQTFIGLIALFALVVVVAACGGASSGAGTGMKKIMDKKVNDNLTVTLFNAEGKLKKGEQELTLSFTDGSGKPVEIKAASLNFNMPAMGTMAEMNNASNLTTTSTAGQFRGSVNVEMAGEWIAQISYEGAETGKTTMKITAY